MLHLDFRSTTATRQLRAPLDFAAVTDHAEFFGELSLCMDPSSGAYEQPACMYLRGSGEGGDLFRMFVNSLLSESPQRAEEICGEDPAACVEPANSLWNALTTECLDGVDDCDVLVIPHNSNLSSGSMFPSYAASSETFESAQAAARLQAAMEPILEIFQHKGNYECFNGFPGILGAPDELCEFEQVRSVGVDRVVFGETHELRFCDEEEIGRRGFAAVGCVSRNDFFRSVLLTGLQDDAAIGVNPYKFGAIGSTDTHLALAGDTDESESHVFLDRDSRGDRLYADALAILDRLRASDANAVRLGDVPFTRSSYEGTTKREVSRQLGRNFARQLFELGTGTWQGPIQSGFGLHLVLLTERMPSRNPAFEDVALEVRRSHAESQRREIRSAVFAEMRRRYVVEMPLPEKASLK